MSSSRIGFVIWFQCMWLHSPLGLQVASPKSRLLGKFAKAAAVSTTRRRIGGARTMASSRQLPLATQDDAATTSSNNNNNNNNNQRPLVVIIAGSTGVGKSNVAAMLCRKQHRQSGGGLIVSADSVQAYRHVQIGANKPTAEELLETPHLLINVADSHDAYNAAEWMDDALYVIRKLHRQYVESGSTDDMTDESTRQRRQGIDDSIQQAKTLKNIADDKPIVPVIVGGTMMYIQWLVYGKPDAPSPTLVAVEKAKETIQPFETDQDWMGAVQHALSLHASIQGPVEKLFANDWYRLRRILEVAFTVLLDSTASTTTTSVDLAKLYSGERSGGLLTLSDYDVRCFFLCPHDRMMHTRTVDERCEQMLLQGLIQETCDLALSKQLPDMAAKAIGYRQVLDYLGREGARDKDYDAFLAFLEDFTTATRQYSRRQVQWFRKDNQFVFASVDLTKPKKDRVAETAAEVERMLSLSRDDFDSERLSDTALSAEARRINESQGKGMKTYMFRHHILTPGSSELERVLQQADDCTHRFQAKRRQTHAVGA